MLQRKLIKNKGFYPTVSLDYLYTVIHLSLKQILQQNIKLDNEVCENIFTTLIEVVKGPVKLLAFKAISHNIKLLLKSLQYIEYDMKSLGAISFSYQQLVDTADLNNNELCKSLTRLILEGVPYEAKWAELLIKMSSVTLCHR